MTAGSIRREKLTRALTRLAGFALAWFVTGGALVACSLMSRPATYGAKLAACNEAARTLAESVACENKVRAEYGRPLRSLDGGAP